MGGTLLVLAAFAALWVLAETSRCHNVKGCFCPNDYTIRCPGSGFIYVAMLVRALPRYHVRQIDCRGKTIDGQFLYETTEMFPLIENLDLRDCPCSESLTASLALDWPYQIQHDCGYPFSYEIEQTTEDETTEPVTPPSTKKTTAVKTEKTPTTTIPTPCSTSPTVKTESTTSYVTVKTEKTTTTQVSVKTEKTSTPTLTVKTEKTSTTSPSVKTEKTSATSPSVKTEKASTTSLSVKTEKTSTTSLSVKTEKTSTTSPSVKTEKTSTTSPSVKTEKTSTTSLSVKTEKTSTTSSSVKPEKTTSLVSVKTERPPPVVPSVKTEKTTPPLTVKTEKTTTPTTSVKTEKGTPVSVKTERTSSTTPSIKTEKTTTTSVKTEKIPDPVVSIKTERKPTVTTAPDGETTKLMSTSTNGEITTPTSPVMDAKDKAHLVAVIIVLSVISSALTLIFFVSCIVDCLCPQYSIKRKSCVKKRYKNSDENIASTSDINVAVTDANSFLQNLNPFAKRSVKTVEAGEIPMTERTEDDSSVEFERLARDRQDRACSSASSMDSIEIYNMSANTCTTSFSGKLASGFREMFGMKKKFAVSKFTTKPDIHDEQGSFFFSLQDTDSSLSINTVSSIMAADPDSVTARTPIYIGKGKNLLKKKDKGKKKRL